MSVALPTVCIFGALNIDLRTPYIEPYETPKLDCHCFLNDSNLESVLAKHNPVVIISFGVAEDFPNLMRASWEIRKRWIVLPNTDNLEDAGKIAIGSYVHNILYPNRENDIPLVTVFTPTYKTGEKIMRPFHSLLAQSYKNWEWVIMDDSDDDGETFKMLEEMAERDSRIRLYKNHRHTGNIGKLKRDACMLGHGEILVEMDHDDELTENALDYVVSAFGKFPEAGFVYTDFAECYEDGTPVSYGQDWSKKPPNSDWGFGYGSYRKEVHGGQEYSVANAPNINPKTIRHIVAAPNHIRSWRTSTYIEMGGHNPKVHVADDYELMVRTFLHTRMVRVPQMCYVQYRNFGVGNTHQARNKEIQRLVRCFSNGYDVRIHERFLEMGVDDFVWKNGEMTFPRLGSVPNPPEESHCTLLYEE